MSIRVTKTAAFIRKNTSELYNKLREYRPYCSTQLYREKDELLCFDNDSIFSLRDYESNDLLRCEYIDCGTNESLFLFLANQYRFTI